MNGLSLFVLSSVTFLGTAEERGVILSPMPFQVIQREGYDPHRAHVHQPGGPVVGSALVTIIADWAGNGTDGIDFRTVMLKNAFGRGTDWASFPGKRDSTGRLTGQVRIPAGGWYKLELRGPNGITAATEPVGVGELFLIAGQSYAGGYNDELFRIEDAEGRCVNYDYFKRIWVVANDPPPNNGTGGSIWPVLGNHLVPLAGVPIGFINVSVGATSSRQWLPGERLYRQAATAGQSVGRFRAVLWQQGESDVIEKTSTATYVKNLAAIRAGLTREWGFAPAWFLAKSTLHPTVYNAPEGEGRIRAAIDELVKMPGFKAGPDTDILGGDNRGGPKSRRHFSGLGQRRAALMWFAVVWQAMQNE